MKSIHVALILAMTCAFASLGCDDEINTARLCDTGLCSEFPEAGQVCLTEAAECIRISETLDEAEECIDGVLLAVCSERV
jgi:hypothetical protein